MLRQLADDLWVYERPQRFLGLEVGTRMSVVRLRDGGLFLHSPVRLDDALRDALGRLGQPVAAVAPNRFHHLYIGDYRAAFPGIALYGAPGLAEKRPDLSFDGPLDGAAPPAWASDLDQMFFAGYPLANEVAFCHRASQTLLLCDLAFNFGPDAPLATRAAFRLLGASGFGPSLLERACMRDRAAARASLEAMLAWGFSRVVVAHGQVLEQGGPEALRRSYDWLLRGPEPPSA